MVGALWFHFTGLAGASRQSSGDAPAGPLSSKHAVVFSGRTAAPLARALCVGKDSQVVEISRSGEAMGLASFNTIRSMVFSGLEHVTIVNRTISLRLLEALCEEFPGLTIDALLPRAISWKSDGFRYLKSLIRLQRRYSQLNLLSYGMSMRAFATELGGKVGDVQLGLPKPYLKPAPGPITVLIGRGSSEIPSQGHIVAAVALARRRLNERIDKIIYEAGSYQVGRILETFSSSSQKVRSLDQYIIESCGRLVLVAPYPDGMTDSLALLALERGGLALVAKGALPLTAPLEKWLSINYWEQSDLICDRLCELISNYDVVQNLLLEPPETRSRVHKSDVRLVNAPLA